MIADILEGEDSSVPQNLFVFDGELFFSASGTEGNELYKATIVGDANENGGSGIRRFSNSGREFR